VYSRNLYFWEVTAIIPEMPPTSRKMNETERAICARLRKFRESIQWPQAAFAEEIGLSRDQLAGIEYCRTPLKLGVARKLSRIFDLNINWLVTGEGRRHADVALFNVIEAVDPRRDLLLLSEVYSTDPEFFTVIEDDHYNPPSVPTPGFQAIPFIIEHVVIAFKNVRFRDPFDAEILARCMCLYCDRMMKAYRRKGYAVRNKNEFLNLPSVTSERKTSTMTEMQELIARLERVTAEPGKKSALAEVLGVPNSRVSEWLRKKSPVIPSGETTLKLLKWVEQQEKR